MAEGLGEDPFGRAENMEILGFYGDDARYSRNNNDKITMFSMNVILNTPTRISLHVMTRFVYFKSPNACIPWDFCIDRRLRKEGK